MKKLLALVLLLLLTISLPAQVKLGGAGKVGGTAKAGVPTAGGGSTLNTSLVAYWKLDEASGTRADSSGSNTLTDNNTVTSTTGKISNAGVFAAANNESLSHTSNSTLQMGDIDFTLAAWVYLADKTANRGIIGKWSFTSGESEYGLIYGTGADRFRFLLYTPTDNQVEVAANTFGSPSTATWYLVIAWHDATANTVNISVNDGTVDSAGTGGSLQAASGATFWLGALEGANPTYPMDGRIDEVGIWKKVLTSGERTELYNSGAGKTCCPF